MFDLSRLSTFATVDLVRSTDEVKRAAIREPVVITEHSKPRFVLMTTEDYVRLRGAANPHRHIRANETPDFILELFGSQFGPNTDETTS